MNALTCSVRNFSHLDFSIDYMSINSSAGFFSLLFVRMNARMIFNNKAEEQALVCSSTKFDYFLYLTLCSQQLSWI